MTETNTVLADVQSQPAQATSQPVDSGTTSFTPTETQREKTLTQSEVNELVGRVRQEARDKGRRDAMAEAPTMGGMPQYSEDHLKEMFRKMAPEVVPEILRAEANKAVANQIANEFIGKYNAGKDKYSDFEQVVAPLNLASTSMSGVVQLLNQVDNTADVLYELGNNVYKIAPIMQFAQNPETWHLAAAQMNLLSSSIKANNEALKQKSANEPLSQVRPSNTGTDSGLSTVSDLRRQSWMKR